MSLPLPVSDNNIVEFFFGIQLAKGANNQFCVAS
jgi:hypothetical protein